MKPVMERKVILVGSSAVGKTCFCIKCVEGIYYGDNSQPTIAGQRMNAQTKIDGTEVRFSLYDTAGQERYQALTPVYARDSIVVILMFDLTNRQSYDDLPDWKKHVADNTLEGAKYIVVGAKHDLEDQRTVFMAEGSKMADTLEAECYYEISSKDGYGIEDMVVKIGECILAYEREHPMEAAHDYVTLSKSSQKKPCC